MGYFDRIKQLLWANAAKLALPVQNRTVWISDIGGLALPFLQAADTSTDAVAELAQILMAEIQTVLFCTGNANLAALAQSNCLIRSK